MAVDSTVQKSSVTWLVAGLVILSLLAMYAPKFAGVVVVLLVTYLGLKAGQQGLV